MGLPAAKQGDLIVAMDIHVTMVPAFPSPVPVPIPYPFNGVLDNGLSTNVNINGRPAAVLGSTATNTPPHVPAGLSFQKPPSNQGRIVTGSATVMINGKPGARASDSAMTCNDPVDLPIGHVVAVGNVLVGG